MRKIKLLFLLILVTFMATAKEYHVAKNGDNRNSGTSELPFLSIQAAANVAQPGDIITVHKGIYRERITPPRGGESETKRIVYQAAEGEKVEVKGSEIIKNWERFFGNVWKVTLPNSFFGAYNPYKDLIHGDWFRDSGRIHHTGEVYLNCKSLWESATLENVLDPKPQTDKFDPEGSTYTWFCESDKENTYIYANFHKADPNNGLVEINVRKSCFYPEKTGINYITIRGFEMSQAATQWAPPTAEQIGLIGTNWSKGWIIENNTISDSRCTGITLGKYGDEFDNTSANSAEGYVETVKRAHKRGWSKENIGSHIIRNNTIYNCEQAGIVGSLGGVFSEITNNHIYDIWTKRLFSGAEMAGIKIHAAIDMLIEGNRIHNVSSGIWLDWMAQGTRVSKNLFYDNGQDLLAEVNNGPYMVDNNIFLSEVAIWDWSDGGAYLHNLIAGNIKLNPSPRLTPYHPPHSTEIAGLKQSKGGDDRFYNNIFVGGGVCERPGFFSGLKSYNNVELPMFVDRNVYLNGANPYQKEVNLLKLDYNPDIQIDEKGDGIYLTMNLDKSISKMKNQLVSTELLGSVMIPKQQYENPDGSAIIINTDYFGNKRDKRNPTPGPFENPVTGKLFTQKVW